VTDPGQRPNLITVQAATVTTDDYGAETPTWATYTQGWAKVHYGTGRERREAAQERASQTATFEFDWTPLLGAVTPKHRLQYDGANWDVINKAIIGQNHEVHITAVTES
jgi:SPP1 family predicted phage head-tail adaptor